VPGYSAVVLGGYGLFTRARRRLIARVAAVLSVIAGGAAIAFIQAPTASAAAQLLPGFAEQVVFDNLNVPTNIEFAPDGRVFVAEKAGIIKVFDNVNDTTPTVVADLSNVVHNVHDRGLLGLAIHPEFPVQPYIYVLYTYDAPPYVNAPYWNDNCDRVGGPFAGKCVVMGQLSRIQLAGNQMVGSEQVLLRDWCQQYPSHSIGDIHFGADGMLYLTAGDGASYDFVDYGQTQSNPCMDPASEGGALRSQDIRSLADPTQLQGAVLRLDPLTGTAAAGNPNSGLADTNARKIVATGFRNPFRFAMRPGTNEVWLTDVGWNDWEEINRVPTDTMGNHGWPCYEGNGRQAAYDAANLPMCETLYAAGAGAVRAPYYTYKHSDNVVANENCPTVGGSSASGVAFYPTSGGTYPAEYRGAMFWADYTRGCIWAMMPTAAGGLPNPTDRRTFVAQASAPVDIAIGPGGDLYYVGATGSVRRIRYFSGNQPPVAVIQAAPTSGNSPLTVQFDGSQSYDADAGDVLRYEWDFNGDGVTDSTAVAPSFQYQTGTYTARLTVKDTFGTIGQATVLIQSGNGAPTAFIDTPAIGATWKVGQTITFSGHATDPQQGTLPASALKWRVNLHHCATPGNCHVHPYGDFTGATASIIGPDHEYPSYVELVLTVTDNQGLSNSVSLNLQPRTVNLTFTSNPPGLQLVVGSSAQATPFTRTVIEGSTNSISAVTPQMYAGNSYRFVFWSDGGKQTRVITADGATAYSATYARPCVTRPPQPVRC
jgi:glucose/arabinose dehydrogenase